MAEHLQESVSQAPKSIVKFAHKYKGLFFVVALFLAISLPLTLVRSQQQLQSQAQMAGAGSALRFTGTGTSNVNRVNIPLNNPERPVDVGVGDFTIEWWMLVNPGEVTNSGTCRTGDVNWIEGDILIDRDINGTGDYGDFGISLFGSGLAFGVGGGSVENTICGGTNLSNGQWHHVAATRNSSTGQLRIFVDGVLDGQGTGPTGNVSYRNDRGGSSSFDPYLVLGAEKHNFIVPLFRGTMDELRVSNSLRYTTAFARPTQAFTTDPNTVALYHFDDGTGTVLSDSAAAVGGPSNGTILTGGNPSGPVWVTSTAPISTDPNATPMPTATPLPPTPTPIPGAAPTAIAAYGFNEGSGTGATDASGNNVNGTIMSGTWNASGRYGGTLSFNGTSTRVVTPSMSLPGTFTLMSWINNPSNQAYETVMMLGTNRDLYLRSGIPQFYDGTTERTFGSALSTNTWHHLAVISDGTTVRVYVNGVQWGSTQTVSLGTLTGALQVGAWNNGSTNTDFFSGLIDEPRVYARALTQAEIQIAMSSPYGGAGTPTPTAVTPTLSISPTPTPTTVPTAVPSLTPTTPTTLTYTLNPVADSYVDNASTTTRASNYGTATIFNVDSSPVSVGYLRFDLTPLAGRTIVSANLRLRTATDTSSNQQRVRPVSNNTWSETGITYNNRPAFSNTILGTISSQNIANTWQQVSLTSHVAANAGGQMSLAIDSNGSNNIWFYSRESTSRPELVIQAR